jgi:alkylation response protein AidB-like acyl-CoA dehydrogenase
MDFELSPITEAGVGMVGLAEEHAADFATRADYHDRDGSFPFENYKALQESGFMSACVPAELGGMGVDSVHDLTVAFNRLGRGDGATAIGAHMHVPVGLVMGAAWREALAAGDETAPLLEVLLRQVVSNEILITVAGTEAGSHLGYPQVEATPAEGGWKINGRKIFGTNSPAATFFTTIARFRYESGQDKVGFAFVPRDSAGFTVLDNWDAMGMRASGSNDLVYKDCFVPDFMINIVGDWDDPLNDFWLRFYAFGNPGLIGAFLGIAETARDIAVDMVTKRRKAPSNRTLAEKSAIQREIAEMEIDLAASRAMLARSCVQIDELYAQGLPPTADAHQVHKEFQCAKTFVNRKAIDVVDRALTVSGGAGYLSASPLSRLYRDVRAGPFMQPYSPIEAYQYIGKVALGLEPTLEV